MAEFIKRLNPNVVFVTLITLIVIGVYVSRQEYLQAERASREAECARQSVWMLGGSEGVQANDIISLGALTTLCVQSGGTDQYQKWAKQGTDEKAKKTSSSVVEKAK